MQPKDQNEHLRSQDDGVATPPAESPSPGDNAPGGPADRAANARAARTGINPQHVESMPRQEDDSETETSSPEFNDRPGQGTREP